MAIREYTHILKVTLPQEGLECFLDHHHLPSLTMRHNRASSQWDMTFYIPAIL